MEDLIKRIMKHEGLRLLPYKDTAGNLTIGIGRNLDERGISRAEAIYLMRNDLYNSRAELSIYDWFNKLDRVRQEVLIELHFNIGLPKLLKFKLMIRALREENFENASKELLDSLWATQVGKIRSTNMAKRLKAGRYQILNRIKGLIHDRKATYRI